MTLTWPWAPEAAALLTSSARHHLLLTAYTAQGAFRLTPTSGTVTMDEDHTPRVQATIGCQVPPDQATIDALDPRRGVQVSIRAGYTLPNGRVDVHPLARLMLTGCVIRRPQQDMVLTLQGREDNLVRAVQLDYGPYWPADTDASTALKYLIQTHDPGAPMVIPAPLGTFQTGQESTVLAPGESVWPVVQAIADRCALDVFDDGHGTWHVVPTAALDPVTRAWLATGRGGSITASESERSRSVDFANTVVVVHEYYTASGPARSTGLARVEHGPFGVGAIGHVSRLVTRPYRGTAADARRTAATLVRRTVSRGRRLSLEAAHAPYWIRPGHTVQVQLPTGDPERHIVSRLDIDLPAGSWSATTRLPENVTVTEGE